MLRSTCLLAFLCMTFVAVDDAAAFGRCRMRRNCPRTTACCQRTSCCQKSCVSRGDCSADLDASVSGDGVRIVGSIDCGVDCDVDVRLTASDPRAEFQCTAGDVRTMVRLTRTLNNCVKAEGKACVKFFGSWECTGWNNLGTICP